MNFLKLIFPLLLFSHQPVLSLPESKHLEQKVISEQVNLKEEIKPEAICYWTYCGNLQCNPDYLVCDFMTCDMEGHLSVKCCWRAEGC